MFYFKFITSSLPLNNNKISSWQPWWFRSSNCGHFIEFNHDICSFLCYCLIDEPFNFKMSHSYLAKHFTKGNFHTCFNRLIHPRTFIWTACTVNWWLGWRTAVYYMKQMINMSQFLSDGYLRYVALEPS